MVPSDLNVPLAGGASAPQRQDLLRQQLKRDLRALVPISRRRAFRMHLECICIPDGIRRIRKADDCHAFVVGRDVAEPANAFERELVCRVGLGRLATSARVVPSRSLVTTTLPPTSGESTLGTSLPEHSAVSLRTRNTCFWFGSCGLWVTVCARAALIATSAVTPIQMMPRTINPRVRMTRCIASSSG
jgi:hypothetical protein